MAREPRLIRRPLAVVDGQLVVGFDRAGYAQRFEAARP
jgi:arsenate reductase-like glutaredoxin family protein